MASDWVPVRVRSEICTSQDHSSAEVSSSTMSRSCRVGRVHVALVPYGAERPGRSIAEIDLSSIIELASVEAVEKIVQGIDQVPGGLVVVVPPCQPATRSGQRTQRPG